MIESQFQGQTVIHRLDPRVKFLTALIFSVVVAVQSRFTPLLWGAVLPVVVLILARLNPLKVARRLAPVNGFILMLWLILPLSYSGHPIYRFGPLTITEEGIRETLLITVKSNLIVLAVIGLLSTSAVFDLVYALQSLRLPNKLVQLFFFSYRYIPVLYSEYERLHNAMKMRGFRAGTNLHTYRSYAYLVGMLLLRSYERSQRVYQAMLMRGFDGRFRTIRELRMKRSDALAAAAATAHLVGVGYLIWMGSF
ncbi:TPA: cobalt ECF transporter T component CbiQ [Candidatus Poribacteria bacterium]|nr:cobalt ECF transporter T component CbiQ [Candidatus Poribacteria bacterium]